MKGTLPRTSSSTSFSLCKVSKRRGTGRSGPRAAALPRRLFPGSRRTVPRHSRGRRSPALRVGALLEPGAGFVGVWHSQLARFCSPAVKTCMQQTGFGL